MLGLWLAVYLSFLLRLRVCFLLKCLHTLLHCPLHLVSIRSIEIKLLALILLLICFYFINFLVSLARTKRWFCLIRAWQLFTFSWPYDEDFKAILFDLSKNRIKHEISNRLRTRRYDIRRVQIIPNSVYFPDS